MLRPYYYMNNDKPILTLPTFLDKLWGLTLGKRTLFRGQREDCTLLPRIARNLSPEKVERIEQQMLQEFRARSIPYLNLPPKDDEQWDWLAIAQHYGMATRLLDWTDNALAALWFAVCKEPEPGSPGVVWVFRVPQSEITTPEESPSPFELDRTAVFRPKHLTRTIIAQGGWFTAHKLVDKRKGFIPLERISRLRSYLHKLHIHPHAFQDLRRQLALCGMNQASMFPGPERVCDHLNELYATPTRRRPCKRPE